jgi:hypothetical protein
MRRPEWIEIAIIVLLILSIGTVFGEAVIIHKMKNEYSNHSYNQMPMNQPNPNIGYR